MDFLALVQHCAPWAAPQTMAAIVRKESGFNPLVIGINGGSKLVRQPASKEEAVATASWLIAKGYNIDMGLGQINSKNLARLNLNLSDVFDECKNIAAAARLLSWNFEAAKGKVAGEQQALLAAISTYNTGNMVSGFQNGYVAGVVANAGVTMPSTGPQLRPTLAKSKQPAAKPVQDPNAVWYVKDDGTVAQTSGYTLAFE